MRPGAFQLQGPVLAALVDRLAQIDGAPIRRVGPPNCRIDALHNRLRVGPCRGRVWVAGKYFGKFRLFAGLCGKANEFRYFPGVGYQSRRRRPPRLHAGVAGIPYLADEITALRVRGQRAHKTIVEAQPVQGENRFVQSCCQHK